MSTNHLDYIPASFPAFLWLLNGAERRLMAPALTQQQKIIIHVRRFPLICIHADVRALSNKHTHAHTPFLIHYLPIINAAWYSCCPNFTHAFSLFWAQTTHTGLFCVFTGYFSFSRVHLSVFSPIMWFLPIMHWLVQCAGPLSLAFLEALCSAGTNEPVLFPGTFKKLLVRCSEPRANGCLLYQLQLLCVCACFEEEI